MPEPAALQVTIVGVTDLAYRRPEPASLLSNRIYVLAECESAGRVRRVRTAPVRRSARPTWRQSFACRDGGGDDGPTALRVTLMDLRHNIIGSAIHEIFHPEGGPEYTAHVELLTVDVDAAAVVGTLELRIRPSPHRVEPARAAEKTACFPLPMPGKPQRSEAIDFTAFESPDLAEQLTQLYLEGLADDMSQCPVCATRFAVDSGVPGELAAGVAEISEAAAVHYSKHRVRCPECELEFCAACQQAPFHVGAVSCEAAALAKEARKCRFCTVPLSVENLPPAQGSGWRRSTRTDDSWCSSVASKSERYLPSLVCRPLFAPDDQDQERHWGWCSRSWSQDDEKNSEWIAFDLGERAEVQKMRLVSNSGNGVPKRFSVERSATGAFGPWERVQTLEPECREKVQEHELDSFSARWLRVVFHSTVGGGSLCVRNLHFFTALPAIANVCDDEDCQARAQASCDRMLPCGHACCGIAGEPDCGACLHCLLDASPAEFESGLRQEGAKTESALVATVAKFDQMQKHGTSAEEFCPLCWTESLGAAPSITLACGHTIHSHCAQEQIARSWPGGPITFSFMECPVCRKDMEHPQLDKSLAGHKKLREQVRLMAVEQACEEHGGPDAVELLADAAKEPVEAYAMRQSVFKQCWTCKSPFFFGAAHCGGGEAQAAAQEEDKEGILCKECEASSGNAETCDRHGTEALMWKCRYCCSPATYECFSYAHFCDNCHEYPAIKELMDFDKPMIKGPTPYCNYAGNQYQNTKELWEYKPCKGCNDGGKSCPLGITHARTGIEHCMGCQTCLADKAYAAGLVKQLKAIVTAAEYKACEHRADERDYDDVRNELAINMLRDDGAVAHRALLAGKLTKRECVHWMRDWGLGSGALVRLGLKGKPEPVAKARTVQQIADALLAFIREEAPQIQGLVDLLGREERVAARVQAVWRGRCSRKVMVPALREHKAAKRIQRVWRSHFCRSVEERIFTTWVMHEGRLECGIRLLCGTNALRRESRAAVRIQARIRGMKARRPEDLARHLCADDYSEHRVAEYLRRILLQRFGVSAIAARSAATELQSFWRAERVRRANPELVDRLRAARALLEAERRRRRLFDEWLGGGCKVDRGALSLYARKARCNIL